MAIPISKTPILSGKEAEIFQKKAFFNTRNSAPKKEVEEAARIFISVVKKQTKNVLF